MATQLEIIPKNNLTISRQDKPSLSIECLKQLNWKSSETAVYKAMNTGISFQEMSSKQQNIAIIGTVLKISIISGCQMPTDERYIKTLECEMKKFMAENNLFSKLTTEEIFTAFRFNAAGQFDEKVKHWQNMFNLDYLGEVLTKWVRIKRNVEVKADRAVMMNNLYELSLHPILEDEEAIKYSKDLWTSTGDYMFIESRVYGILTKSGVIKLNEDDKERIRKIADIKINTVLWKYFQAFTSKGYEDFYTIIPKKIAVAEYFGGAVHEERTNTAPGPLQDMTPYI